MPRRKKGDDSTDLKVVHEATVVEMPRPQGRHLTTTGPDGGELLVPLDGPDPDEDGEKHLSHPEKLIRALTLRMAGATYKQIADAIGCSVTHARNLVVESMDDAALETSVSMARMHHLRLEHMFMLLWREVNNPVIIYDDLGNEVRRGTDKSAVNAALAVLDRLERLWGINPALLATEEDPEGKHGGVLVIGAEKNDYIEGLKQARKALGS